MRVLALVLAAACTPLASAQVLKIERAEPAVLKSGEASGITLHGPNLEGAELWTSFEAKVERLDEKAPKFRVQTDFQGAAALRMHSEKGASNWFFLSVDGMSATRIACAQRGTLKEAQELPVPASVDGNSTATPLYYRFPARAGENLTLHARGRSSGFDGVLTLRDAMGRRLAYADDSQAYGADPMLAFVPPADGDYVVELADSQYRAGQAFRLHIDRESAPAFPSEKLRAENGAERSAVTLPDTIYARFETPGDRDDYQFSASAGTFLTITPLSKRLRSSALPRLKLAKADGTVLVETPQDAFDLRVLRQRIAEDGEYLLSVSDAFGGHGENHVYGVELRNDVAPFELSIPRQPDRKHPLRDCYLAVPGGVFETPVQCVRHGWNEAIGLQLEPALPAEQPGLAKGQGNIDLRARLPQDASPGQLRTFRVTGRASIEGMEFKAPLRTAAAIRERQPEAGLPEMIDGLLGVRVVDSPLVVEPSAAAEITAGEKAKVEIKLAWHDEKQRFNAKLRVVGLPEGVSANEMDLKAGDLTTALEIANAKGEVLRGLRIEARLDYHGQPLLVQSAPFELRVTEKDVAEN